MEGIEMVNLKIIEGNYNAHVNAFDRAFNNKKDYRMEYENGYLTAIEYVLKQLGVEYEIDVAGYMTIKEDGN